MKVVDKEARMKKKQRVFPAWTAPLSKLAVLTRDPALLFIAMVLLSAILFFAMALCRGDGAYSQAFFRRFEDLFMDYFNSVRDASQGAGAYTERNVIYPPFANLLFLLCARLGPWNFNATDFAHRQTWVGYPAAIFLFCIIAILCALLIFAIFSSGLKRSRAVTVLFGIFAVFNAPALDMLERGNVLVVSLIGLAVYAFTYHSESPVMREIGLMALAISSAIKLYPLVFMWFLLTDRRFCAFIRCAIYTFMLFLLPSFFFGGPSCLIEIVRNITSFSSSAGSWIDGVAVTLHMSVGVLTAFVYGWIAISAICFAVAPLINGERWRQFIGGLSTILVFPSLSALYAWSLFLIPLVLIANEPEASKKKWIYFVFLTLPFLLTVSGSVFGRSLNSILVRICAWLLSGIFTVDTAVCTVCFFKNKHRTV